MEELTLWKCPGFPKESIHLMQFLSQHHDMCHSYTPYIRKCIWNQKKKMQMAFKSLRKKEQSFWDYNDWNKTILQGHFKQNIFVLSKEQIDMLMELESPEINPLLCEKWIFNKGCKIIQWSKDSLFNKWCWENGTDTGKKMKLNHHSTPYKNKLKIDKRFKWKLQKHKNPKRKHRQWNLRHLL